MTDPLAALASALADHYRVLHAVGRGGMATVYLAEDLKHGRKVALKVLHPELAAALGTERFLSEIRTTAALQHPNILPLFDSGESAGLVFYVMPFVEGESLRQRLEREQQLPVDEAVRLAQQVAGALDHAHRHGIIHRDIKPENILLSEGQPLVADFGVALAVSNAGGMRLTASGLSVGTPQYMSPEQAAADREVDRRTDVYSLGAVLYEMLAGAPPYTGPTAAIVTARKMTESVPPLRTIRDTVSGALEAVVRKALARTPADRFATAQEFAQALDLVRTISGPAATESATTMLAPRRRARQWLPWAVATIAVVAAVSWTTLTRRAGIAVTGAPPVEFPLPVEPLAVSVHGAAPVLSFAPDGRSLAYVSGPTAGGQLFIRRLDAREPIAVQGVTRAVGPFFSPDGEWVAYGDVGDSTLKKVRVTGGAPVTICKAIEYHGGTWGRRGTIAFAADPDQGRGIGIWRVSADGGAPRYLVGPDSAVTAEMFLTYPSFLPDGRTVLYATLNGNALGINISALDVETGQHHVVTTGGGWARYVDGGYVVYAQDGTLMAAKFDARRAVVTGAPGKVRQDVLMDLPMEYGLGHFDVSSNGTLAYLSGPPYQRLSDGLAWIDRAGRLTRLPETGVPAEQLGMNTSLRLSPDGKRVLVSGMGGPLEDFKGYPKASSLWIYDLGRGSLTRLVPDQPSVWSAVWLPDGQRVAAMISEADRPGVSLFLVRADGVGAPERLTSAPGWRYDVPWSVTADGSRLFYFEHAGGFEGDVWTIPLAGDRHAEPLYNRPSVNEWYPAISPDGRWLAYVSNEGGRPEVYLTDYPARNHRWQVSAQGGEEPEWNSSGRELFFAVKPLGTIALWSVPFTPGAPEPLGKPLRLFETTALFVQNILGSYDPAPGGQRFLVMPTRRIAATAIDHLTIVVNWTTELRSLVK